MPGMSIIAALAEGFRRMRRAPRLTLGLWLVSLVAALPAGVAMGAILRSAIGASLTADSMRRGFDMEWFWRFNEGAGGIATAFGPDIVGAGAFYNNLESWITGGLFGLFPGLVALGVLYGLLWAFLMGGVIERLTSPWERTPLADFVQSGGRHFARFVRLAILTAIPYVLIHLASRWFYGKLTFLTRDVTSERTIFVLSLLVLGATALLMVIVQIAADYARIATVLEGRRSMLLALAHGVRFVLSRPGAVLGIYAGVGLAGLMLLALYAWLAPGAGQSTWAGVLLAFVAGQIFLCARVAVRVTRLGSEVAFYQAAAPERRVAPAAR